MFMVIRLRRTFLVMTQPRHPAPRLAYVRPEPQRAVR